MTNVCLQKLHQQAKDLFFLPGNPTPAPMVCVCVCMCVCMCVAHCVVIGFNDLLLYLGLTASSSTVAS